MNERGLFVAITKSIKMIRVIVLWIVLASIVGSLMILPGMASAESGSLQVQIQIGMDGKIKPDHWFPVKFTITNSGEDVSGELAVHLAGGNGDKDTTYVQKVDLPAQSTKEIIMSLPGGNWHKRNSEVKFYKDSAESGKVIEWSSGPAYLETSPVSSATIQVGIIARDPDTMNFLNLLSQRGYELRTFPIPVSDLPQESFMLDSLDVLVLNDIASDQFQPEQIDAITSWVQRGGKLFLAGGAGYPKTAQRFEELSPVRFEGTEQVTDLSSLAAASGRELALTEPFTLSKAAVKEGANATIHYSHNGLPLFASAPVGKGEVWYVAYDTSLNPLASWNGNPDIWERVLSDLLQQSVGGQFIGNIRYTSWEMNEALEYFPSLAPPSIGLLVLAIIFYAIIIGPILYFTLRKLDRREWLWFAIPLVAVVFSVGIYGVGASGRGSVMAQSLRTVELDGTGKGLEETAAAVFIPKGGKFNMQLTGSTYVIPFSPHGLGNGDLRGSSEMIVEKNPENTNVLFQGVSYWSVRKILLQTDKLEAVGKMDYTAQANSTGITGELTNRLGQRLTHVGLFMNGQLQNLGELGIDETVSFQLASSTGNMYLSPYDVAQMMFPYGGRVDENKHKRSLLLDYVQKNMAILSDGKPYLFGFTESREEADYQVGGKRINANEVTLWVQPIPLSYVNGSKVHLPPGTVLPTPDFGAVSVNGKDPNGRYYLGQGEVILNYVLPDMANVTYEALTAFQPYMENPGVVYEIWNEAKQVWEPIDKNTTISAGLADYYVKPNMLKLKAVLHQEMDLKFPDIAVEGAVNP